MDTPSPNIVLFVPDSYRGDVLGHQENPGALTPNLDALTASGAVSYNNAFAQNPVCTPSRCSFMTGLYPHVHGHRSMLNMLDEKEPNLLTVLRREGYAVWWAGKNDLVSVRRHEDYLRWCDVKVRPEGKPTEHPPYRQPPPLVPDDPRRGAYYGGVLTRRGEGTPCGDHDTAWVSRAADMIRHHPGDRPFLCYIPLHDPHPPYRVEEEYYDAIDPDRLPPRIPAPGSDTNLPPVLDAFRSEYESGDITEEMWRDVKRIYYAMCAKVDALLGTVVDALTERDLYDDTWIMFFSDHGDFTGDYSLPEKSHCTLQDCLLRVPLIVKPPAGVPVKPGRRRHLVELLDITATLYDLLGIDPGYASQGVSLRSSLAGDETEIHDAVFAEVGARRGEEAFVNREVEKRPPDSFYARQGRAAIRYHKAGSHAVMCRTTRHKYVRRCYTGHHELFDLEADPGETRNLSGNPAHADVERRMETRLLDFLLRTADVLPYEQNSRKI
jgi:arylsulfatase A-like enzyme